MGLRDEIQTVTETVAQTSVIDSIISALGDEGDELREILADSSVPASVLQLVLKRRGFSVSDRTIQRYRRNLAE